MVMTCVSGHLTDVQFGPGFKDWSHPPPESLFDAPIVTAVTEVGTLELSQRGDSLTSYRVRLLYLAISNNKPGVRKLSSSGRIVIEKASI